jgi:hypothetical protein
MKNSDSTEMDRLLRRHARRNGETLRAMREIGSDAVAAASAGSHLDADEMNAYAEGALPEAARSRYFSHLADCDSCRKLVTDLTLAASVSNEGKARVAALDIKPPTSWHKWLSAIFSPPVLRYGVPALALFAVIIVAIVATRSQRDAASVAQNKEEIRYSAPAGTPGLSKAENTTATGTAQNHSNSNTASITEQSGQTQPVAVGTPLPMTSAPLEADAPTVSQETVTRPAIGNATGNSRDFGESGKRAQDEVAAAPPPPVPQSPVLSAPAAEPENRERREAQKESKAAGKDDNALPINGRSAAGGAIVNKRTETSEAVGQTASTTTAGSTQNQTRRRPSAAAKSGPADMAAEKERSAETRNVGGRRFQKQGGAWVDISYNSSRSTTNIRRGSEQYRALVADEPGLRAIAQQLGGEVIVIWKSRAYRFY